MPVIPSRDMSRIFEFAGAPVTGTDEVQTITFGGTPTGGTFKLNFQGQVTASITWVNVNATLVGNIDTALEALSGIGSAGVTTAVGTMTAGIGTITVTFNGVVGKQAVDTMTVAENLLLGTGPPTIAIAETTPGVTATGRGMGKGKVGVDTTNGILYINTGTTTAPTLTKVGTQT
jgi:hypothetical protein